VRVAYVYPGSRAALTAEIAARRAPDTDLLGQNHLSSLGFESWIHEPRLRPPRSEEPSLVHRLAWNGREVLLPFELRSADAVVSPLANLLPLTMRATRAPRVVLFDWALGTTLRRVGRFRRRLLVASARAAAVVACPSEAQRQTLVDAVGLDPRRVVVLELGADAEFFAPAPEAPSDYVVAVGKDLARDYGTLFEAARRGGFRTIVVSYTRNVAGLRAPDTVELRQGLSWSELRKLIAGAAVSVLPLHDPARMRGTDASGLTALLESMASGKAIVATRRPALESYIDDGRTGILVPHEDPEALAGAITGLLADDAARADLGRAARMEVDARLNTRAVAARTAVILRSAIARYA